MMHGTVLNIFVVIIAIPGFVLPISVHLQGETYVRRYENIHLNCSTDTTPIALSAELLVNEKTYTSLRYLDDACFSALLGGECRPAVCSCSKIAKWFTHIYQANEGVHQIQLTCTMRYNEGSFSDSINVTILDIKGPDISSESGCPLFVGRTAHLECKVESALDGISLQWICLNMSSRSLKTDDKIISHVSFTVKDSYDGASCVCVARVKGFTLQSQVTLNITRKTELQSVDNIQCNISTSVNLSCTFVNADIPFGFNPWEHSYNGIFIRSLPGQIEANSTHLTINGCKIEDAGNYTCSGWTEYSAKTLIPNQSIYLAVNSPPVIMDTTVLQTERTVLSVLLMSDCKTVNLKWLKNGQKIENSSMHAKSLTTMLVPLQMYGTRILITGCQANLTTDSTTSDNFEVAVENEIGVNRRSFQIRKGPNKFDLQVLIFSLTAIGIFIFTSAVAAIIMRARQLSIIIVGPLENSPGIPMKLSETISGIPSSEQRICVKQDNIFTEREIRNILTHAVTPCKPISCADAIFSPSLREDDCETIGLCEGDCIYHSAPQTQTNDHIYDSANPQYLELSGYEYPRPYADVSVKDDTSEKDDEELPRDYEEIEGL